ncbi:MAG TPA: low affinity iron permease family protein [Candidatus Saccharimonadales bacterium]|nr:low affinity iron permease family protein [Candidatus Saccharimonadales bacterium]
MKKPRKPDIFTRFTSVVSTALGRPWVFVAALAVLVVWALSGPVLGFSNTWQLIINTSTTIITFLMVFIIQNTQNRDTLAIKIKLDAIMRELGIERDDLLRADQQSDGQLEKDKRKIEKKKRPRKKR